MALVTQKPSTVFDLTQVARGDLLWGRHTTWTEGKAGFVTSATEAQLAVQYYPGIGNVTNHFIIPISEAVAGQWQIRWSTDMALVQEYAGSVAGNLPETEGDGCCVLGRTDL